MSQERGGGGAHLGWFVLGAALGAISGVLLAPRPGEESRQLVSERLEDAFAAGREAMREEIRKTPRTLG